MGSLTLPAGGTVYVVERIEPYRKLMAPMWQEARPGRFTLASSELVVLETLVKPLRELNVRPKVLFRSFFGAAETELIPATLAIWEDAARVRAVTGLATSDALHAATAFSAGCELFISNDTDFRRLDRLPA